MLRSTAPFHVTTIPNLHAFVPHTTPPTNHPIQLFSIYCASKWAVEGFTEAISQEVKPEWNIKFV